MFILSFLVILATSSVSLTNTTTASSQLGTTVPEAANEVTIGGGNNTDDPIVLSSDSEFESKLCWLAQVLSVLPALTLLPLGLSHMWLE